MNYLCFGGTARGCCGKLYDTGTSVRNVRQHDHAAWPPALISVVRALCGSRP